MATVSITSGLITAELSAFGAELVRLTDASGADWLHDGQSFWNGHAPLLFPIVGALVNDTHVVDGRSYTLPKHGFARRSTFEVLEVTGSSVSFLLEHSAATLAVYPFKFRLVASYRVDGDTLAMEVTVHNVDDKVIPVAFGYHPAFRWPLPGGKGKAGTVLQFEQAEACPVEGLNDRGEIDRQLPPVFSGTTLPLDDGLFDQDALIFLSLRSRALVFRHLDDKGPELHVDWEHLPHLGIWTKPGGAPYLCIEPWQGYASRAGFTGSLAEKDGSLLLNPGDNRVFKMRVSLKK